MAHTDIFASMGNSNRYPERIVCLTEETTETLYLLGQEDRIVGISGFTVRPPRARKDKPKVSTFLDARIDDIVALKPDLVIGFSNMQASIAKQLIERGITVWVNNHYTIKGIFDMVARLGAWVGESEKALQWIKKVESDITKVKNHTTRWAVRPKVYFEEWPDPQITAIGWVSELIAIAGGINVFAEKSKHILAQGRILADTQIVVDNNPDIILASWCGKMFKKDHMLKRPNWHTIEAVKNDALYEVDSSIILQPGPAAVTEGLQTLFRLFKHWVDKYGTTR